ncbi:hypothetical protein W97_00863 [Coniosporium apollinis CBS 100218]|uniref:Ubiquinol-cytochrome c reductase subunit 10 n=1 Tax=Coniosporium apollinis (strain CBS 100218) TaxID=1168221 RepID=R7YIB6_CONA1|nr:uncharacterized protein W97_00863 [Coniosporium apollinis CBS 100218]EON61647.1 hypothetical protein W97_00863 [Coniosporium apollinis CBS 100218]
MACSRGRSAPTTAPTSLPTAPTIEPLPTSTASTSVVPLDSGAFGAVAGIFALFFFAEVPKVRKDIMQRMPIIGDYFIHEIPPEDNPF